ncbi:MAG: aminotransferase class V-fold PLP-dependent enzyme [Dethiobacteria bacterium]
MRRKRWNGRNCTAWKRRRGLLFYLFSAREAVNISDQERIYYFDNAATSWPKPEEVYLSAEKFLRHIGGNPGRSGHARSLEADRLVYRTRSLLARFFNAPDPSCIVFTLNATDALNLAIKGLVEPGDHVIFTAMEHNSVLRPLGGLRRSGTISTTMVPCDREGFPDLDFLERSFQRRTRLVICNHASNVSGTILPVEEICRLAHAHGAHFLLDAAQTAGVLPLDVAAAQFDLLAFAGHKSLLGPPGTGGLYVRPGLELKPWREGGTGSHSEQDLHPETMPERLEAGTLNGPGLAGLEAGVSFIESVGLENICRHERQLRAYLKKRLQELPGVRVYGPEKEEQCVAVLSFTVEGIDCGELGHILENSYGILCRTGLHCAPLAHKAIGTYPQGTVRLSPGYFNTAAEVDYLAGALEEIIALAAN